ncbi:CatB-related O-acetyltransferase [Pseudomonas putida]
MIFDREMAFDFYRLKILLAFNSTGPGQRSYDWMPLPAQFEVESPITIEERTGLYGGPYKGSIGAPLSHGLCAIGSFSFSSSCLPPGLVVGRYCSLSAGLVFLDSHHPIDLLTTSAMTFRPLNNLWRDIVGNAGEPLHGTWDVYDHKPFPVIGNDVWIGRDVTLAMGITIGDGAIIAAGSLVTKDVPPYTIVGGNPASVIRVRFPNEIAFRLQKSQWWNKAPAFVARISALPAEQALQEYEVNSGGVEDYVPRTVTLDGTGVRVSE